MQKNERTVPAVRVQNGQPEEMHNFLSYDVIFGFAAAFDNACIGCCLFVLEQHPEISVGIGDSQRYMEHKLSRQVKKIAKRCTVEAGDQVAAKLCYAKFKLLSPWSHFSAAIHANCETWQ